MGRWFKLLGCSLVVGLVACGGSTSDDENGGSGGAAGSGGTGGSAGTGASAGTGGTGGTGGTAGTGGAAGTGGTAGTAGTGGGTSVCPTTPPTGACTNNSVECWYGDDPRPYCRTRVFCYEGNWTANQDSCPPPTPPSDCPADWQNPPDGICGAAPQLYCDYGGGVGCDCSWNGGASPPDGGIEYVWDCMQPPSGSCPAIIPNAGEPCAISENERCEYGFMCEAMLMECVDGFWALTGQMACASAP